VDESGDLFVTGYTITATNNDSYQTVKYRKSDGTELWQVSLDVSTGRNDRTIGIGLDPTGNVLVAGWTDSATNGVRLPCGQIRSGPPESANRPASRNKQ